MTETQLPPVGIYVVRPSGQKAVRKVRVLIDLMAESLPDRSASSGAGRKRLECKRDECFGDRQQVGDQPPDNHAGPR